MNFMYSQEEINRIGELASELTPPGEIAILMGLDPDHFMAELSNRYSAAHRAYFKGKAETANMLRKLELEFARVGSPLAVQMTGTFLHDMTAAEDF